MLLSFHSSCTMYNVYIRRTRTKQTGGRNIVFFSEFEFLTNYHGGVLIVNTSFPIFFRLPSTDTWTFGLIHTSVQRVEAWSRRAVRKKLTAPEHTTDKTGVAEKDSTQTTTPRAGWNGRKISPTQRGYYSRSPRRVLTFSCFPVCTTAAVTTSTAIYFRGCSVRASSDGANRLFLESTILPLHLGMQFAGVAPDADLRAFSKNCNNDCGLIDRLKKYRYDCDRCCWLVAKSVLGLCP